MTDTPLLTLSQLFMVFLTSSGVLASSISFNAMSEHGTCTVVFAVVAAIIIGVGCSARTFKQISWLGWAGLAAIVPSILIVVIACGVSDRPPAAPAGPFDKQLKAFNNPSFVDGMVAVVNVLFAYCGTPGFFSVIAEMKVRASLLVSFSALSLTLSRPPLFRRTLATTTSLCSLARPFAWDSTPWSPLSCGGRAGSTSPRPLLDQQAR